MSKRISALLLCLFLFCLLIVFPAAGCGQNSSSGSVEEPPVFSPLKVLVPEALPSLTVGAAIAITTILGYSAMAGIVGGGGLGDIAIRYGYYRYETGIMVVTVVLLVVVVQIFQEIGMKLASHEDKRK